MFKSAADPERSHRTDNEQSFDFKCKVSCCVPSAPGLPQRKGISPGVPECQSKKSLLKFVKSVSCVTQLFLCQSCLKCNKCCLQSACRGQTSKLLANLAESGCRSESSSNPERRLHASLSDPAKTHKVSHSHKLSCQSPEEQLPTGGITSAYRQKCSGTSKAQNISELFQQTFPSPKTKQQVEAYLRPHNLNLFLKTEKFKMETPETIRTSLQQGEWVTSIDFKDAYFHIPIQEQSRKYLRFHVQGQTYQLKALPFRLSTAPLEFTVVAKEVKKRWIHQYLDDWLVRAKSHQVCLQYTQELVKICQKLGWLVNLDKSELEPKQIFDFVGYQFNLRAVRV